METGEVVAGRYRILRELGRGGMGAVYLAQDQKFEDRVALKLAVASGHAHDEFRERFKREARIGNLLGQSRGFVRAFDWGTLPDGTTLYLAMDLVEGARDLELTSGSLAERVERVLEAARLVEAAHVRQVVHRDLKPENFLRAADGSLWLADFGLAKELGEPEREGDGRVLTQTGMGMGTPYFMPPEQFENAKDADPRADVYALGVMLFHAVSGGFPYEGRTASEILARQMRVRYGGDRQPEPRGIDPRVPHELNALCVAATALDRQRRTPSARALVVQLEAWLAAGSARALPSRPPAPLVPSQAFPPRASEHGWPQGDTPSQLSRPQASAARPLATTPRRSPSARVAAVGPPAWQQREVWIGAALALLALGGLGFLLAGPRAAYVGGGGKKTASAPAELDAAEIARLQERARLGDVNAMLRLGVVLERQGSPRDASVLFKRAATRGSTPAMIALGQLYLEGRGVRADASTAKLWFDRAAERGDDRGEQLLAAHRERQEARRLRELSERLRASERTRRERELRVANEREGTPAASRRGRSSYEEPGHTGYEGPRPYQRQTSRDDYQRRRDRAAPWSTPRPISTPYKRQTSKEYYKRRRETVNPWGTPRPFSTPYRSRDPEESRRTRSRDN